MRSPAPGSSPGEFADGEGLPDAADVLAALPEGLLVVREGQIVEVNEALCDLLGFPGSELVGARHPFPFTSPEDRDRFARVSGDEHRGTRDFFEAAMVRKDGGRIDALVSVNFLDEDAGGGTVMLVRDVSERRRREERLARLAARDELTGLPNKRSFHVTLAGEVARSRRHRRPMTLVVLDVDGFKRANELGGHRIGDRVLAEVAGRLGALVRTGEHLARIGGDEFGWILPDADAEGAAAAVTRAQAAIAGEPFREVGVLTLSAGLCQQREALEAKDIYTRADRALYEAKAAGGNSLRIA